MPPQRWCCCFSYAALFFNQLVWRKTVSIPRWITDRIAGNAMPDAYEKKNNAAVAAFSQLPIRSVELHTPDGARLAAKVLTPEKPNGRLLIACHGARSNGIPANLPLWRLICIKKAIRYCSRITGAAAKATANIWATAPTRAETPCFGWTMQRSIIRTCRYFCLGYPWAATVLMMSDKVDPAQVKGIIADCAYTSAWAEFRYQLRTSFHLPPFPILHICNLYCKLFAGYSFHQAAPIAAVAKARVPVLFIHGKKDDFVPFFMRDQLYNACPTERQS